MLIGKPMPQLWQELACGGKSTHRVATESTWEERVRVALDRYGPTEYSTSGDSEELLGQALRRRPRRIVAFAVVLRRAIHSPRSPLPALLSGRVSLDSPLKIAVNAKPERRRSESCDETKRDHHPMRLAASPATTRGRDA